MDKRAPERGVKIGAFSRIDWGSDGFRAGLLQLMKEKFEAEGVHFVVLAGGLVSGKALKFELKEYLWGAKPADKGWMTEDFLEEQAGQLANYLPRIKSPDPEKSWCTIYIVTSPVFDGKELGPKVAEYLTQKRQDIKYWADVEGVFPTKQVGREITVLTPRTFGFRGEFFSTPVQTTIRRFCQTTRLSLPDLVIVGGYGVDIQKPKGESKVAYVGLPVLSVLYETRTGSENQVGVSVVEYLAGSDISLFRTHHFNDILAREREFINPPDDAPSNQKAIVDAIIKHRGGLTIGLLAHELKRSRKKLRPALEKLVNADAHNGWPGLVLDEGSKKYDFPLQWLQHQLLFKEPGSPRREYSAVSFGCMHGGSIFTDYKFFLEELPKVILRSGAKILVGAGDFIEGLHHDLILKEVYLGMNYTRQEKFSALVVAEVMVRVFEQRFKEAFKHRKRWNKDELRQIIDDALLNFIYISGNHCEWTVSAGFHPLETFRSFLVDRVDYGINRVLENCGVDVGDLTRLVKSKVVYDHQFTFGDSEIGAGIVHPHMARAKTHSIRPQEVLNFCKDHIVFSANFHTTIAVGEWDSGIGQRKVSQNGTIKTGTGFEDRKLKTVDKYFNFLRFVTQDNRIVMTEVAFYGAPDPAKPLDNDDAVELLRNRFDIKLPFQDS